VLAERSLQRSNFLRYVQRVGRIRGALTDFGQLLMLARCADTWARRLPVRSFGES
jgi:hypothetical protein